MASVYESRVRLGGYETRALELDGEGAPVVMLHGYSDSADTWRILIDRLRRRGRRAVAYDMPGFGAADRLPLEGPILPELDRFATAAIERAGPGAVLMGNSLGGAVALRAAQTPDHRLAGIVPIAPAGLEMAPWLPLIEGTPVVRTALRAPFPLPRPLLRGLVGRAYRTLAFADQGQIDPRAVSAFTSHFHSRRDVVRMLATGHRLLSELRDPFSLGEIKVPVLVIWGERDRMVYSTGAARILEEIPESRLETLPGTGHCPQIEVAGQICDLLCEFADGAGPPRREPARRAPS